MNIANPVYDSVFKYLLDDNRVAKIFISAIIGEEITDLHFATTEAKVKLQLGETPEKTIGIPNFITVLRIDFSARIRLKDGTNRLVLIEIQKAKLPTDIMRFRRYLGHHYLSQNNTVPEGNQQSPLPLLTIYFLGHALLNDQIPVIKVSRSYTDLATGQNIELLEPFIESLTHDSYVIQVPALKHKRRTDLEQMLQVFDQDNITNDKHLLNISEEQVPEKYHTVVRRPVPLS